MAAHRGGQGGVEHVRFMSDLLETRVGRGKGQIAGLEFFLSGPGFSGLAAGLPKRDEHYDRAALRRDEHSDFRPRSGRASETCMSADLLRRTMANHTLVLSPQNLNECHRILIQRRRLVPEAAARSYLTYLMPWCIAPLDAQTTVRAWAVQDEAGLAWRDALLAASALMAGCKLFISEDMRDGQLISSMTIVNTFNPDF